MAYYKCSIEVLVQADCDAEALDCMAEAMRPLLRTFTPTSSVIDWRYNSVCTEPTIMPHDGEGFKYE